MMKPKVFRYSNGYDYKEYSNMCNLFTEIHFPFMKGLKPQLLLADYVFSISMDRMVFGFKNTLRRFFGSFFRYKYIYENIKDNGTIFVFTLDEIGRPDYMDGIRNVASQCDNSGIVRIQRTSPKFCFKRLSAPLQILIYSLIIFPVVKNFNISLDMGVYLYRAKCDGRDLFNEIKRIKPGRIVTFCDFTPIETVLTQLSKENGIPTATLQHGNGDNIFYGSCSDFYLSNSILSKDNLIKCESDESRIIVCGPMKYAGLSFEYNPSTKLKKIGVVFDGAKNLPNNIKMIDIVHEAIEGLDVECLVRFHPNNKKEEYKGHVLSTDRICESLEEFEKTVDLCIVYNSSMYTDMIYKRIPVVRYKNGDIDLFPELDDQGFSNCEQLKKLFQDYITKHDEMIETQKELYSQVFGEACGASAYREFFNKWTSQVCYRNIER